MRNFPLNFQAAVRNLATGDSPDSREGCFLPPLPLFRGFLGFTRCSPPLFPVSCPILHLALLSENDESRPNVPQSR